MSLNASDLIKNLEKKNLEASSVFKPQKDETSIVLLPSSNDGELPYLRASMAEIGGVLFEFPFYKTHKDERRDPENWYQGLIGTLFDKHPAEYRDLSLKDRYIFQVVELDDDGKPVFDKTTQTYVKLWKPSPGLAKVVEKEILRQATKGVVPFGWICPAFVVVKDVSPATGYPDYSKSRFGEKVDISDIKVECENHLKSPKDFLRSSTREEVEFAIRSYLEPRGINLVYRTISTGRALAQAASSSNNDVDAYEENLLAEIEQ